LKYLLEASGRPSPWCEPPPLPASASLLPCGHPPRSCGPLPAFAQIERSKKLVADLLQPFYTWSDHESSLRSADPSSLFTGWNDQKSSLRTSSSLFTYRWNDQKSLLRTSSTLFTDMEGTIKKVKASKLNLLFHNSHCLEAFQEEKKLGGTKIILNPNSCR
jgi:hypothetical protein